MTPDEQRVAQYNIAAPGASIYAVQNGDQYVYIYPSGTPYRIEPFPLTVAPLPQALLAKAPSWMLSAHHEVVPFIGRDDELARLLSWRNASNVLLSILLIHAPGGQGKTRLAGRFAALSTQAGWSVMQARHHTEIAPVSESQHVEVTKEGLLLVVDYAERWPIEDIFSLLCQHQVETSAPVRVLLLARSAGEWWQSLTYQLSKRAIIDVSDWILAPLAEEPTDRWNVYARARDEFARFLVLAGPEAIAAPNLEGAQFDLVLALHMKALVDVDAAIRGSEPPSSVEQSALSSYLLNRERDIWRAAFADSKGVIATSDLAMSRTVYLATLMQSATYDEAVQILVDAGIKDATSAPPAQVIADHAILYPPTDETAVLEPLYPDRLGEDFIALCTIGHDVTAFPPDPWTAASLRRLLGDVTHAEGVKARSVRTLIQTGMRWPHLTRNHLCPILRDSPNLALAAGGAALVTLAANKYVDTVTLESIEAAFPSERYVDLDVGMAAITARLAEYRLARGLDSADAAHLYWDLAHRNARAGLIPSAITAIRHAEAIYRELTQQDRDTFEALLMQTLLNLGSYLSELGESKQALQITVEVESVCRRRVSQNDGRYISQLASALTNKSIYLSELSRANDALEAVEEAVNIRRELAAMSPQIFEKDLANSLDNLGARLWRLGLRERSMTAAKESIDIRRKLAQDNPAVYEPELAQSLNNYAIRMHGTGREREALAASREGLLILRKLANANPNAFQRHLAGALTNRADYVMASGQPRDALHIIEESADLFRQLADVSPHSHEPALLECLNKLAVIQAAVGEINNAASTLEEAIELNRRSLNFANIETQSTLAALLTNSAGQLMRLGRLAEARARAEEAVDIRRRQARDEPRVFEHRLAGALTNLAIIQLELGELDDSLSIHAEALGILRRLAEDEPNTFNPDLADSVYNFAVVLQRTGNVHDAIATIEEAIELYRNLASQRSVRFKADLANSLENRGIWLTTLGHPDSGLAAIREAVDIVRILSELDSQIFGALLGSKLANLSVAFQEVSQFQEARTVVEEALQILIPFAERFPDRYVPEYIRALAVYADSLDKLGQTSEATSIRDYLTSLTQPQEMSDDTD